MNLGPFAGHADALPQRHWQPPHQSKQARVAWLPYKIQHCSIQLLNRRATHSPGELDCAPTPKGSQRISPGSWRRLEGRISALELRFWPRTRRPSSVSTSAKWERWGGGVSASNAARPRPAREGFSVQKASPQSRRLRGPKSPAAPPRLDRLSRCCTEPPPPIPGSPSKPSLPPPASESCISPEIIGVAAHIERLTSTSEPNRKGKFGRGERRHGGGWGRGTSLWLSCPGQQVPPSLPGCTKSHPGNPSSPRCAGNSFLTRRLGGELSGL